MPQRMDAVVESAIPSQTQRISDVQAKSQDIGSTSVYIPETDTTKAYPVDMSDAEIGKDIRTYEIKTEDPDVFPGIKEALDVAKSAVSNLPVAGGLSAEQIGAAAKVGEGAMKLNELRDQAFKWVALGMPTDMEGIKKAEESSWVDLFRESPVYKTSEEFWRGKGVAANTAIEFGTNMIGTMTDFTTDPIALVLSAGIGEVAPKAISAVLQRLQTKNPLLYAKLTKPYGMTTQDWAGLPDAYKLYDLQHDASEIQIKKAYKNAALKYHPDRGGRPGDFDRYQQAYDLIMKSREKVTQHIMELYNDLPLKNRAGYLRISSGERNPSALIKQIAELEKTQPGITAMAEKIRSKQLKDPAELEKYPILKDLWEQSIARQKIAEPRQAQIKKDIEDMQKALTLTEKQHEKIKSVVSTASKVLRKGQEKEYGFDNISDYARGSVLLNDVNNQYEATAKILAEKGYTPINGFAEEGFGGYRPLHWEGPTGEIQVHNAASWKNKTENSDPIYHEDRHLINKTWDKLTKEEQTKLQADDIKSTEQWKPIYSALDLESIKATSSAVSRTRSERSPTVPSLGTAGRQAPSSPSTLTGQDRKSTTSPVSLDLNTDKTLSDMVSSPSGISIPNAGEDVKPVVNINNLNISDEAKARVVKMSGDIKADLQKVKGGKLTHDEVLEAAKMSEVLKNGVSRDTTLKFEAQLLATRQQLAALAEGKNLTREFVDSLRVVSSLGTDIARSLESMKIRADSEYAQIKVKVIKDLIKLGMETDKILDAAKGVDFTKQRDVTKFYRQFVKPKISDIIDEFRYTNMLSSPATHIVNTFSNILQTVALNPLTKMASGAVDYIGSQITGSQRTHYYNQIPAFYRGVWNSAPKAAESALAILRGEGYIERPDLFRVGSGIEALQVIPRLLEASDIFFRTMVFEGELEAMKFNQTLSEAAKIERAKALSEYYVFRQALDPKNESGQGDLLATIDKLTRVAYQARKVPIVKWFVPFLQTPMNIFKQGIEYSPLGAGTIPGSKDKADQIGKALLGSMVFLWAASKAFKGEVTWGVPRSKKEKDIFYASGRKPYSIRFGDTWVGISKIGPMAYPIAMAAAWQYYMKENPDAISDSDGEKVMKVIAAVSEFLSDQSYMQGIGDIQKTFSGDQYKLGKSAANLATQMIPLSALLKWVTNFTDPFFRETEKGLSVESIVQNIVKGIPGASNTLPVMKDKMGRPVKKQSEGFNAFSPVKLSQADKGNERRYQYQLSVDRMTKKSEALKEKINKKLKR